VPITAVKGVPSVTMAPPPWLPPGPHSINDACGSADNYCNNGNIQACQWRDKECQGVGRPMPWLPPGPHSINDACSAANNYCNNGNIQACQWRDKECQGVVYATGPGVGNAAAPALLPGTPAWCTWRNTDCMRGQQGACHDFDNHCFATVSATATGVGNAPASVCGGCEIEKSEIKSLKTELSDVQRAYYDLDAANARPVPPAEMEVNISSTELVGLGSEIIKQPRGHRQAFNKLFGGVGGLFLKGDIRDMPDLVGHVWKSIGWDFDSNGAQINEIARADVKQSANTVFGVKFSHVNISKTENPVFTMTNSNIRQFRRKFAKRLYYTYYSFLISELDFVFNSCRKLPLGYGLNDSERQDSEFMNQVNNFCGIGTSEYEDEFDFDDETDAMLDLEARRITPSAYIQKEYTYHFATLRVLSSNITKWGGVPPPEGFQQHMTSLVTDYRESMVKLQEDRRVVGETIEGRGDSTRYAFRKDIVMPPDTDVETFTVKAKEVILTIVKDEKMPGWVYETIPVHAREEIDGELGLSLNTAKWSEIFRAMEPTNPDGVFRSGGETRDMIIWQRRQIIIIVSYVLRHLKNNEEWIISTMAELMSGHYKSNEYVSLAVEFFTILGRSVGLNRLLGDPNDTNIKKYVDSLRNLKTSSDALIYDLRRTVDRMQEELAESEENKYVLAQQIQSYIETIDGLEITVADLREKIEILESKKTSLNESLNSHRKTITELDATIKSLNEQLEPLRSDNTKLTSDLKNKIEEHNTAVKAAAEAAVTATTECAAVRDELIKNHEEAQKANEENVAELNESKAGLDTTIASLGEQIETLKSDKTTLTGKITDLEASLAENTCAVDIEDAEVAEIIDEAVEEITTLDSVTKKLTKQKKESETKLKKAEEDLAMRNKIIIGLAVFIFILIIVLLIK
jgi:uncharacterized coiled-coil DUF342 family protein